MHITIEVSMLTQGIQTHYMKQRKDERGKLKLINVVRILDHFVELGNLPYFYGEVCTWNWWNDTLPQTSKKYCHEVSLISGYLHQQRTALLTSCERY